VTIIDSGQLLTDQSRHGLNEVSVMSHRDLFGPDAKVDELADQPTGNRVRVGAHTNGAAGTDFHTFLNVVCVEPFIGQAIQMSQVIKKVLPAVVIGPLHQIFHEVNVFFAAVKTPTATQQQRLFDTILEMAVGRFDVAVFIGTASVRAFCFAIVVTHQSRIPFGEFATTGVISHGRRQRITAMPFGHATEFPERFLNAGTERFKRLRKAQRHAFNVTERQHTVEERVFKSLPGDLHTKLVADREVTGRESPRMMFLAEENRLARTMQTSPFVHAPLKGATCGIRELIRVSLLHPFEQCLGFQLWLCFEPLLNFVPDAFEGIGPSAIRSPRLLLRRQPVVVAVCSCRFLAHFRHPCRIGQSPAHPEQSPKFFDPSIRDHRNLHENQELQ